MTSKIAETMGIKEANGFLVTEVTYGSPAHKAGIRGGYIATNNKIDGAQIMLGGDIIARIDNKTVGTINDVYSYLNTKKVGDTVQLAVTRENAIKNISLALAAIPVLITEQQKGSPVTDSITMTVNLKPHENPFLAKDGYYQVSTWYMNAIKGSKVCPSGDCQYSIEDAEFSPSAMVGYLFVGLLKVSVVTNDTTDSKFYPIYAELYKKASQEKKGQTMEFLQGSIGFGRDINNPDFEYTVDNGERWYFREMNIPVGVVVEIVST